MTVKKEFRGRALLPGSVSGRAAVTREGFNTLASYIKSAVRRSRRAVCSDQNNRDLYRQDLTDKIICLPRTIGSTMGGLVIMTAAQLNLAPRAFLFSEEIDSLACSGVVLTDVWGGKRIVTVDRLGPEFLHYVQSGMPVEIREDGTVIVG
jgi:predicted aconitase with swiveling domain